MSLRVIGLDPSARRLGFGRRLVEQIELAAVRLGVGTSSLGADDAIGFYTHLGYELGHALRKQLCPRP